MLFLISQLKGLVTYFFKMQAEHFWRGPEESLTGQWGNSAILSPTFGKMQKKGSNIVKFNHSLGGGNTWRQSQEQGVKAADPGPSPHSSKPLTLEQVLLAWDAMQAERRKEM